MNKEIAKIFYEMADILEVKDVEWKPRAYRKAAKVIENLSKDVKEIYEEEGIKGLDNIPGVGQGLAKKIEEYLKTKQIKEYIKLKKSIPKGLTKLMDITGIGAKKAKYLYQKLKIKNIKELEKAAKKGKIRELERFGEKSEKDIEENIQVFKKRKTSRFLLGVALSLAENIIDELKKLEEVKKIIAAGSLRRMLETIGDIDILVTTSNQEKVIDAFTKLNEVEKILAKGQTKAMVILKTENIQADIRVVPENDFGSALQYFTGSKEHSISLRNIAIKNGLKLNEYGLFRNNKKIVSKTEEDVYQRLGLQYIPPELRENKGEIELAKQKKLPELVNYSDIKGDLHLHTKYSDGNNTVEELANAAKKLNYEYIAITDHSKTRAISHGLKEEELLNQIEEIKRVNNDIKGIMVLAGIEVDILGDGSLDYDDKILKKLDIVVAAIHSGFKADKTKMTDRIVKALENRYVNILDHPTGRIINGRKGYELDLEQIFEVAKEKNKILGIDCFMDRLDLNDENIKRALEFGIKFSLGTDAHNIDHLKFMKLGVGQAKRGWARKEDIINTYPLEKLKKILKK